VNSVYSITPISEAVGLTFRAVKFIAMRWSVEWCNTQSEAGWQNIVYSLWSQNEITRETLRTSEWQDGMNTYKKALGKTRKKTQNIGLSGLQLIPPMGRTINHCISWQSISCSHSHQKQLKSRVAHNNMNLHYLWDLSLETQGWVWASQYWEAKGTFLCCGVAPF